MRRVVVTGMGLVTPLGIGLDQVWRRLLAGESGVGAIQSFDVSDLPARIAAQVPRGDRAFGLFNADDWIPPKDYRRMDEFIIFAMAAAVQAVEDAGWQPDSEEERERTGVMIGSGIGGLPAITEAALTLQERGPRRISRQRSRSWRANALTRPASPRWARPCPMSSAMTSASVRLAACARPLPPLVGGCLVSSKNFEAKSSAQRTDCAGHGAIASGR